MLEENRQKILILLLILLAIDFIIILFVMRSYIFPQYFPGSNGDIDEHEKETVALMDTYTKLDKPTINYGSEGFIIVGEWVNATEAFLYFDFEDEPDYWEEVEISLHIYNLSESMEIEIYLISALWDETTLTWQNRPVKGPMIHRSLIKENKTFTFNVIDEVEDLLDDDKEGISICIHHSNNETSKGHFQMVSSEGYINEDEAPFLIWKYEIAADIVPIFTPLNIILIVGLFTVSGILGFLIVFIWYRQRRKLKKEFASNIEKS